MDNKNISLLKELKDAIFPFDTIKFIILIISFSYLIGFFIAMFLKLDITYIGSPFSYIGLISWILFLIIIPILDFFIIILYLNLFNFFKKIRTVFNQKMAVGFKIIASGMLISILYHSILYNVQSSITLAIYTNLSGGGIYLIRNINILFSFGSLFIQVYIFYGVYKILAALRFYPVRTKMRNEYNIYPQIYLTRNPILPINRIIIMILIFGLLTPFLLILYNFKIIFNVLTDNYDARDINSLLLTLSSYFIILLILILELIRVLYKYKISNFFKYFKGRFEIQFSKGFMIIVIGYFFIFFENFLGYSSFILQFFGIFNNVNQYFLFVEYTYPITLILNVISFIIIIYGLLILQNAMNYYRLYEPDKLKREDIGLDDGYRISKRIDFERPERY